MSFVKSLHKLTTMKISYFLLCRISATVLPLYAFAKPIHSSRQGFGREQGESENERARSRHRLLREGATRRTSSYSDFRDIWYSAVAESDTISTIHKKCRLEDGTVVLAGGNYQEKRSSKGSMGSKSAKSKGSSSAHFPASAEIAIPTMSPTMSASPTNYEPSSMIPTSSPTYAPTPCHGKDKSCKISKKMKISKQSSKSKLSMMSKSSKSGKSSKGKKGKYNDLPFCSELTVAPTANQNANINTTDAPTSSPTTMDDFQRCNDIRSGTGTTSGDPDQTFRLFALVESNETLHETFPGKLNEAMRGILAVAAGCQNFRLDDGTTNRRLENTPDFVSLDDFTLVDLSGRTCSDAFGVETTASVCTAFNSDVSAYGGTLSEEVILQTCTDLAPEIAETLNVENIQCVVDMFPFEILVPTASPTGTDNQNFVPATATPSMNRGISGISDRGDSIVETGGWIGIAAGLLVLISLCLCFYCVQRAKKERKQAAYTRTFDEDENSLHDAHSPDGAHPPSRSSIFVNPDMSPDDENYESDKYAPTDIAPTDEEEEYPIRRSDPPTGLYFDPVEQPSSSSPVEDMTLHEKGEMCSSPTCRICEERRQQTGSVVASGPTSWSQKSEYPERSYVEDDTVEL